MPSVLVGETHIPRDFARYTREYSFLELNIDPGNVPGKARLQSCRAQAPESFVFSLVLPSNLASLQAGVGSEREWKAAHAVAKILRPRWWVVRTPASVRPTRKAREELAALFARLKTADVRVAWEPHGLWEESAAGEAAEALGVHLVQDLAQQDPRRASVLYARLLAFGRGARVSLGLAERIAERAQGFSEAFVVVEGHGARAIKRALGLVTESASDELEASESDELEASEFDETEEVAEGDSVYESDDVDGTDEEA